MESTEEDKLLMSINNIKSSISEKDQLLWKYQATAKCYADERERLTEQSEELRKRTSQIETSIKDLQPLVPILERSYEIQQMSMKISFESLSIHRSHKKQLELELKKRKDDADRIKREYEVQFNDIKQQLEKSNPHYQVVQEKRADLMKCQVRCKMLEAKIVQYRDIFERRKDIFYAEIISLARRWVAKKEFQEMEKQLIDLKRVEIEWMKKLTEIQDKKKVNHSRYEPFKLDITLKSTTKNIPTLQVNKFLPPALKKYIPETDLTNKNDNAMEDLQNLMKQSMREPRSINNRPKPKTTLDPASKVVILEDKVLVAPSPQVKQPILSRQQRSEAIDLRLQRAVDKIAQKKNNRKRSWYFHSSQRTIASSRPTSQQDLDASMEVTDAEQQGKVLQPPSSHVVVSAALPTTQTTIKAQDDELPTTQQSNMMNITSQEESEMKFVSQDNKEPNPSCAGSYLKSLNSVAMASKASPAQSHKFNNPQIMVASNACDLYPTNVPVGGGGIIHDKSNFKKPESIPAVALPSGSAASGMNFMMRFKRPELMAGCGDSTNTFNVMSSKNNVNGNGPRSDANLQPNIMQYNVNNTAPQYDFGNITQFNSSMNFDEDCHNTFINSPPTNIPSAAVGNHQMSSLFGSLATPAENEGPSGMGFFKF